MANAASIEDGMFSCYSDIVTRARAALWGSLTDLDKAKDYGLKFGASAHNCEAQRVSVSCKIHAPACARIIMSIH